VLLLAGLAALFLLESPWNAIAISAAAVVEVGEVYFWIRFLRRYRVTTGAEGLIGQRAEVLERCEPDGRVKAMGEIWAATSSSPVAAGERVRIVAVEGLTLRVEPQRGTEKGPEWGP
jgi:membrane-bound serine protease (ClpP class)